MRAGSSNYEKSETERPYRFPISESVQLQLDQLDGHFISEHATGFQKSHLNHTFSQEVCFQIPPTDILRELINSTSCMIKLDPVNYVLHMETKSFMMRKVNVDSQAAPSVGKSFKLARHFKYFVLMDEGRVKIT